MTESKIILSELSKQKISIHRQFKCGIISHVDATKELSMIEKKERKLIKQLVLETHVTKDGTPRKITYQESKGLWYTIMPDKSKVYATSEDKLYEKLFYAYNLSITDYSFAGIFKVALDEKNKTENNSPDTIKHYKSDFNRFISCKLASKDIRTITKADLKEHTQTLVNTMHPKKQAFKTYKSILNLTFRYALENEIICFNPVLAIKNAVYYKSCNIAPPKPEEKILTEEEIQKVKDTVRRYMKRKTYDGYFINGYAILLAIETGMRAGELPSLKWEDIKEDHIHIHSQQLENEPTYGQDYYAIVTLPPPRSKSKEPKILYYANWTKDEKGVSRGGRKFPLTNAIRAILEELKSAQAMKGIESEFVFANENEQWITAEAYQVCLRRMLCRLRFNVTHNHAFRMSLNSNVFIRKYNLPETERAKLLGHSVETNLRHYCHAGKDNLSSICAILNGEQRGLT